MSVIKDIRNTTVRFQTLVASRLSVIHEGPDMEIGIMSIQRSMLLTWHPELVPLTLL